MKNATFQITPDMIKESENIQLGQDLKLSCHVDAVPQEKVTYQWFKNGKPARMSKRLLVTRNDPELPAVTSSLELIDLHFSDYGTYLCLASFPGAPVPDLSMEVNISSETGGQMEGLSSGGKGGRCEGREILREQVGAAEDSLLSLLCDRSWRGTAVILSLVGRLAWSSAFLARYPGWDTGRESKREKVGETRTREC